MRECDNVATMMNKVSTNGIKTLSGGATVAAGFEAAGVSCGVRKAGVRDLGLLFSDKPCVSAAVFTRNVLQGAPLGVTREAVAKGSLRAVVVNSGNANAATGERGTADARETQRLVAAALNVSASEVAVASTGVIGVHPPMDVISAGITEATAGLTPNDKDFAQAILTTDTRIKEAAVQVEIGGKTITVGGTAKGSGMIHPNMGTMLAFITTDAAVEKDCLQKTLSTATEKSFNRVTVDGDTSPSDMALLLANGEADSNPLALHSPDYSVFSEAVESVTRELAKEIARDGEGATRLVEVVVEGAAGEGDAAAFAKSVVGSSLVKAAVFGEDANWGRVVTALGYAGIPFDLSGLDVWFGSVRVFAHGEPAAHDESEANAALANDEVVITARFSEGESSAVAWGCDLTYKYVEINGSYRT